MARDHYIVRKRNTFGDFVALRPNSRTFLDELMPYLKALDALIESADAINGSFSKDNIRILPLLRSAAVVEYLRLLWRVRAYYETMMDRIGFRPLPVI